MRGLTSIALGLLGAVLLFYPQVMLGHVEPQPYEIQIARWAGLASMGLAGIRPWAFHSGGDPARRMRRWSAVALTSGLMYVLSANPVFLVVAFVSVVGGALDAAVERATIASFDLLDRLQADQT